MDGVSEDAAFAELQRSPATQPPRGLGLRAPDPGHAGAPATMEA